MLQLRKSGAPTPQCKSKKTGARRGIAYKPTPQENGEVNQRITQTQGAPHGFPPVLRGSAHMVFWIGPAVQAPLRGFVAKRHSLSTGLHSTLRAFATGGRRPPLRSRPRVSALIQKTTSPSANVIRKFTSSVAGQTFQFAQQF